MVALSAAFSCTLSQAGTFAHGSVVISLACCCTVRRSSGKAFSTNENAMAGKVWETKGKEGNGREKRIENEQHGKRGEGGGKKLNHVCKRENAAKDDIG